MISPKIVAEEVQAHLDKGRKPWEAFKSVSQKYGVRLVDVRICASVRIEKLWALWCPNRRKVQVKYER